MKRVMLIFALFVSVLAQGQEVYVVEGVEAQPVMAQALRLDEALEFLGSPMKDADRARLEALSHEPYNEELTLEIQKVLDPYCIAMVNINPEMRVKVLRGKAKPELIQHGWKSFLVKIHNEANTNGVLEVTSPNADPVLHASSGKPRPEEKNLLSPGQVANRFLDVKLHRGRPLYKNLSGLGLEYAVLQLYTKDVGLREGELSFHVGQGTQDIGFRNAVSLLFDCKPSVQVVLRVKDEDGSPTMASFVITDDVERLLPDDEDFPNDYRSARARRRPWESNESEAKRLVGIYPLPARRVAATDEYPDFFFQPQIYRMDGEHVYLPPGKYEVTVRRGPEYIEQTRTITVPSGVVSHEETFELKRWVHMAGRGWYSGDHHVHAAGCAHYESPEAGVKPVDMFRQALGEDLNVACVLTWGPCWYHQKNYFDGRVHSLSTEEHLIRYDVEVSGFPSSHAGHVCLLRLEEDDYPGTTRIEEWPSWTLPVLQWAKGQGGVTGYAHSGWGLEPMEETVELPNYVMPKFDGIGANEYIVTVTHDAIDYISTVDTPAPWELNIWYHTLNCGFRARISGETDYPCIFDDRVGMGRTYVKLDGGLDFNRFVSEIADGSGYVSDGLSHIIDLRVGDGGLGLNSSEISVDSPRTLEITANVSAYLPEKQDARGKEIAARPLTYQPYWDIERCRIEDTRNVPVELVVNGCPVARTEIVADGSFQEVAFEHRFDTSSWAAVRIYPSSHTNPVFVIVDGKPIRASKRSAQWCRDAVDQCWRMKSPQIHDSELDAARAAYDHARATYDRIIAEATE